MSEVAKTPFPLPLGPLEEYMLCDDRPSYPMSGAFRMRFKGYLEQNAFEKSVRAVMGRHPLLRATVAPARRGWRWIDNPGWTPTVQWQAKSNAYGFPNTGYLALTEQPGTRLWVVEHPHGHDVILQVHHACGDALGVAGVMEDLLVGYALAKGGKAGAASYRRLDPDRLLRRNSLPVSVLEAPTFASKQLVGLLGVREFFMHAPDPLLGSKSPPSNHLPPADFPSPLTVEWDKHQTVRLQTAARAQGVSVGVLLLRDLFLTLHAWRKEQRIGQGAPWLRIAVPMGLRSAVHRDMSMADAMSMVFLDRRLSHLKDRRRLMRSIHLQMLRIKVFRLQYTFLLSLDLMRRLPGACPVGSAGIPARRPPVFRISERCLEKFPFPGNPAVLSPEM